MANDVSGKGKITPGGARRIVAATLGWERLSKGGAVGRARPPFLAGGFWYYTTGTISAAVRTGTTVSSSKLAFGKGNAKPCGLDSSGDLVPDTTAATVELICYKVPASAPTIAADRFVYAVPFNGRMQIIHVASCS